MVADWKELMMADMMEQSGFVPLTSEHIREFIDEEHAEWSAADFEAQALWLVVKAREAGTYKEKMAYLAEAQVWATLATSREGNEVD